MSNFDLVVTYYCEILLIGQFKVNEKFFGCSFYKLNFPEFFINLLQHIGATYNFELWIHQCPLILHVIRVIIKMCLE